MHDLIIASAAKIPLLNEVEKGPEKIYIKGRRDAFSDNNFKIAIVGTRRASTAGLATAHQLAKELAHRGITIVSGLALGVDQAAHRGCMEGGGRTIAVLANGLDEIYPHQHQQLAKQIIETGGALVSEYPPGTPSLPHQFLERNRIISGLSRGVVIVEAPFGSGALNTAAHALEQNREIFVVPGAVNNKNYAGSNHLIKQGAALITSAKDVLETFGFPNEESTTPNLPNLSINQKKILTALQTAHQPSTVDDLAKILKLDAPTINQNLTLLAIEGLVSEDKGKYYA